MADRPRALALLLVVTGTLLAAHAAASNVAPPNDARQSAFPVPADTFVFAQPTAAATHAGEYRPCGGIGSTVWYAYTPRHGHWTRAQTHGSNYDTVLALYVDTPLGLVFVTCNDDAPGGSSPSTSRITWYADPAYNYYLQAGGYNARQGLLVFRMEPSAPESVPVPPIPPLEE